MAAARIDSRPIRPRRAALLAQAMLTGALMVLGLVLIALLATAS